MRPRLAAMFAAFKSPPAPPQTHTEPTEIIVPEVSPFIRDERLRGKRQEAALSMADDETYAYVLVTLRKRASAAKPEVRVAVGVPDESWWPPLIETMRRVGRAALTR